MFVQSFIKFLSYRGLREKKLATETIGLLWSLPRAVIIAVDVPNECGSRSRMASAQNLMRLEQVVSDMIASI